jgi:hypothetical protein
MIGKINSVKNTPEFDTSKLKKCDSSAYEGFFGGFQKIVLRKRLLTFG